MQAVVIAECQQIPQALTDQRLLNKFKVPANGAVRAEKLSRRRVQCIT